MLHRTLAHTWLFMALFLQLCDSIPVSLRPRKTLPEFYCLPAALGPHTPYALYICGLSIPGISCAIVFLAQYCMELVGMG